jgi:hypothetical protein
VAVINNTGVHISVIFLDENARQLSCAVDLAPPIGSDAKTWSFYDQKCSDNSYFLSWGYQPEYDAAVMTISEYVACHHPYLAVAFLVDIVSKAVNYQQPQP